MRARLPKLVANAVISRTRWRRAAHLLLSAAVLSIVMLAATDAWACPMCKAALGSSGRNHGDLVGGFFWSILFMLSMPFLILGGLSAYMYRLVRQARRTAAPPDPALVDPLGDRHGSRARIAHRE